MKILRNLEKNDGIYSNIETLCQSAGFESLAVWADAVDAWDWPIRKVLDRLTSLTARGRGGNVKNIGIMVAIIFITGVCFGQTVDSVKLSGHVQEVVQEGIIVKIDVPVVRSLTADAAVQSVEGKTILLIGSPLKPKVGDPISFTAHQDTSKPLTVAGYLVLYNGAARAATVVRETPRVEPQKNVSAKPTGEVRTFSGKVKAKSGANIVIILTKSQGIEGIGAAGGSIINQGNSKPKTVLHHDTADDRLKAKKLQEGENTRTLTGHPNITAVMIGSTITFKGVAAGETTIQFVE